MNDYINLQLYKKNYLAVSNLILSFKNFDWLKSKHFSRFFWWEVNLTGLRAFFLQKIQVSVVEGQKKKFCYPSLSIGKEDILIILLSFLIGIGRSIPITLKKIALFFKINSNLLDFCCPCFSFSLVSFPTVKFIYILRRPEKYDKIYKLFMNLISKVDIFLEQR